MNLPMSIFYSQIFNVILFFCAVLRICIEKCVYGSGCGRFGRVQAIDPFSPSHLVSADWGEIWSGRRPKFRSKKGFEDLTLFL